MVRQKGPKLDPADVRYRRTYGITLREYEKILESQGGKCAICGCPPPASGRRLHLDHKHVRGFKKMPASEKRKYIRGVICWRNNSGLAKFRDDASALANASTYLRDPPAQKVLSGVAEPNQSA